MFIDTLEFTIPIDLCALYATLQEEARSQLEFPASVNSYGTTQDANVQVALRANKVTFKVDGVSSNASIISKSECKTLKLSVFDVDRTLMQKNVNSNNSVQNTLNNSNAAKRMHEQSVSFPSSKHSRKSYDDSPHPRSPTYHSPHQKSPHMSQASNSYSKPSNDTPVNVKQEPEDPDCIEIEPDPEPDDIVPKKETPYMQIDYSSNVPHTQTSQAALERLSFPPTSRSQSSSSSFHQNVPHVQDYSEPGPSQGHHDDQSADDFLVFQDDNECNDDYEEADYSNDGMEPLSSKSHKKSTNCSDLVTVDHSYISGQNSCKTFQQDHNVRLEHKTKSGFEREELSELVPSYAVHGTGLRTDEISYIQVAVIGPDAANFFVDGDSYCEVTTTVKHDTAGTLSGNKIQEELDTSMDNNIKETQTLKVFGDETMNETPDVNIVHEPCISKTSQPEVNCASNLPGKDTETLLPKAQTSLLNKIISKPSHSPKIYADQITTDSSEQTLLGVPLVLPEKVPASSSTVKLYLPDSSVENEISDPFSKPQGNDNAKKEQFIFGGPPLMTISEAKSEFAPDNQGKEHIVLGGFPLVPSSEKLKEPFSGNKGKDGHVTASSSREDHVLTSEEAPGQRELSVFGGKYPCRHCEIVFTNAGRRWHHTKAVHEKVLFDCKCGKTFRFSYNLKRHKRTCQEIPLSESSVDQP